MVSGAALAVEPSSLVAEEGAGTGSGSEAMSGDAGTSVGGDCGFRVVGLVVVWALMSAAACASFSTTAVG